MVYGSLRQGEYNHLRIFKGNRTPDETLVMDGYALYSLGSYPAIKKDKKNSVVMEKYRVTDDEFERIKRMEEGADYETVYSKEHEAFFWRFKETYYTLKENNLIIGGDWTKREVK